MVIRKSALPELAEALKEIGVNFDETKLLPSNDDAEAVEVTGSAVQVHIRATDSGLDYALTN